MFGDLRNSERYQRAEEAFKNIGEINTVVGHSFGGFVALELQNNYKDRFPKSRTYGAPVINLLGSDSEHAERYRNWFDPFSIFDRSAKNSFKWDPFGTISFTHDYSNLGIDKISTESTPIEEDEEAVYF